MGEAVDRLIQLAAVEGHVRKTKGGKVVQVKSYINSVPAAIKDAFPVGSWVVPSTPSKNSYAPPMHGKPGKVVDYKPTGLMGSYNLMLEVEGRPQLYPLPSGWATKAPKSKIPKPKREIAKTGKPTDVSSLGFQRGQANVLEALKPYTGKKVPKVLDTPSTKYGMTVDLAFADGNQLIEKAKKADWSKLPVQEVSTEGLIAREPMLDSRPINKVVSGKGEFREGYVAQLLELDDGRRVVVDGHHRVAMYVALGLKMHAKIMKSRSLSGKTPEEWRRKWDEEGGPE